ncbi:threonylcarbamoyl-AMP synthase [Streptococcus sp. HF-1907]|uniref:L-threonylcarbamoyladenylate synthase n=1 Tax=Streptococcus sp. HF-1907 TaxID=2785793 RepID=UPI0018A07A08|nr:L-threonylcarbamoyladenylate synthase [Streptococcus sp. HF-1907]MBF7093747.1 threonylcarbamoyl-AMP synthase [Streptococcus sp. HF-1907]
MSNLEETLHDGGAIIMPTETVYGIFAKALDEEAVNNVYRLKQRPKDKAMNLNIADIESIYDYAVNPPRYLDKLVSAFLPGPLTIILQASPKVPYWINSGLSSVGFRMPNHPETLAMIKKYGPLIGPSANISGHDSGTVFKDILGQFQYNVDGIEDDSAITGVDSTILDLSGEKATILRQGAITKEDILAIIPNLQFEV